MVALPRLKAEHVYKKTVKSEATMSLIHGFNQFISDFYWTYILKFEEIPTMHASYIAFTIMDRKNMRRL